MVGWCWPYENPNHHIFQKEGRSARPDIRACRRQVLDHPPIPTVPKLLAPSDKGFLGKPLAPWTPGTIHCTFITNLAIHCTLIGNLAIHFTLIGKLAIHCTFIGKLAIHCTFFGKLAIHCIFIGKLAIEVAHLLASWQFGVCRELIFWVPIYERWQYHLWWGDADRTKTRTIVDRNEWHSSRAHYRQVLRPGSSEPPNNPKYIAIVIRLALYLPPPGFQNFLSYRIWKDYGVLVKKVC